MSNYYTIRNTKYTQLLCRVRANWGNASSPIIAETSEDGGKTWEPAAHPWQVADFCHEPKRAAKAIAARAFSG